MASLDDIALILAAQQILNNPTLRAPVRVPKIAVSIDSSYNSPANAFTVFNTNIQGTYGARLFSLSLAVDAIFQSNYNWLVNISSVTGSGQEYEQFDPTVNTFENVPVGNFLIKPGANVNIKAYNRTGTSSSAIMSVYMVYDQLSQTEYTIVGKYYQLLSTIAGYTPPTPNISVQTTSSGNFLSSLGVED